MDFNNDGDWLDAGEHIIVDRVLGTGVYTITFPVPAAATVGNTFARFRYSMERGVGPAGHSTAGEVEDYAVRVLTNAPMAIDDLFDVTQDVVKAPLDVLANDFPSSTGVLRIVSFTQPPHGTVAFSVDKLSLLYTPNPSFPAPFTDVFTYTVTDGTGLTSTASVSVIVQPVVLTPIAVDDAYHLDARFDRPGPASA